MGVGERSVAKIRRRKLETLKRQAIQKMWKLESLDKKLHKDDKASALYQEKMDYERKLDEIFKKIKEEDNEK